MKPNLTNPHDLPYLPEENCDIWKKHDDGYWIIIPTNPGWNRNNENIMGAGIAFQARTRFPRLPLEYGEICREQYVVQGVPLSQVGVVWFEEYRIACVPTKPLNGDKPWESWKSPSTIERIESSLQRLVNAPTKLINKLPIYVPLLGCGCGTLKPEIVKPVLRKHLGARMQILVNEEGDTGSWFVDYQYVLALYNRESDSR